jgi:cob(I)alamin adenosyltransferase
MSVYTRTGDKGKTGTFSGKRISKYSTLINTIGSLDELNSYLGIIGGLAKIQKNIFTINSILSGAKLTFPKTETLKLEKEIDAMEKKLPVLSSFIIYGGTPKASQIYFARSLCRRAERLLVSLQNINQKLVISPYINRLSDYLFTLARFINFREKVKEGTWK